MRYDGLYVSRNTYIRTGLTEWRIKNPVHLVTYFRYLHFFPDGTFTTRTSPEVSFHRFQVYIECALGSKPCVGMSFQGHSSIFDWVIHCKYMGRCSSQYLTVLPFCSLQTCRAAL